jgi:transcriptional regulator with XRE-family HTH domain
MIDVGTLIREFRHKLGITQTELAKRLGITQVHLCYVEHGSDVSLKLLRRLEREFDVEVRISFKPARGRIIHLHHLKGS